MLDGLVSNLSGAEFKIDEDLINFGEKLKRADKNAPGKIYDGLNKMGNDLKKELKTNTPIGPPKKKESHQRKKWLTGGENPKLVESLGTTL